MTAAGRPSFLRYILHRGLVFETDWMLSQREHKRLPLSLLQLQLKLSARSKHLLFFFFFSSQQEEELNQEGSMSRRTVTECHDIPEILRVPHLNLILPVYSYCQTSLPGITWNYLEHVTVRRHQLDVSGGFLQ